MSFSLSKSGLVLSKFKLHSTAVRSLSISYAKKFASPASAAAISTTLPPPHLDGQAKQYPVKIQQLVDQIAQLNLLEVADLNELLRQRLKIKDVAMSYAAAPAGPAAATASAAKVEEQEPEEAAPKSTKSSFKLKLLKYDESKKVALIKEIKALGENMNLVQAKKFIESMPQVFRDNIGMQTLLSVSFYLYCPVFTSTNS
jgi:large subunit ribosomal protein L7/L12